MKELETYIVHLEVHTTHEYEIEARSPEEAESVAEGYLQEGEQGIVLDREILVGDAYSRGGESV